MLKEANKKIIEKTEKNPLCKFAEVIANVLRNFTTLYEIVEDIAQESVTYIIKNNHLCFHFSFTFFKKYTDYKDDVEDAIEHVRLQAEEHGLYVLFNRQETDDKVDVYCTVFTTIFTLLYDDLEGE